MVRRRGDERDAGPRLAQARDLLGHLVRRDLATLARLRPLRDLDLELLGRDRVLGAHAEPSRRDLLDLRVALVAEAIRALAALARVRASSEAVERDRDGLVRFGGERAVRHRSAREATHDRGCRLDLVERDRRPGGYEVEQVARLERVTTVDQLREALVQIRAIPAGGCPQRVRPRDRLLQRGHDVGIRRVPLAALAVLEVAGVLELRLVRAGSVEPLEGFPLEAVETRAAERGGRAAEVLAAERAVEADGVEQAGAAVARHVGDAHLGHDLQDALLERREKAPLRLVRRRPVATDAVVRSELCDRLEREPWADRVCAVAEKACDRVRVARLVRLHEERAARAEARLDQPRVHGREGEDRRHRGTLASCVPVGETEQLGACGDRGFREDDDPVEGSPEPLLTRERRIEPKGRGRLEAGRVEEEPGEYCEPRRWAVGAERVDARAEQRRDGHDEALAEVVDRGIRHLREALSEVGRKRACAPGERRDRRVVAHRRDRIVAGLGERAEHRVQLLAGVAVENVTRVQSVLGRCDRLAGIGADDARRHPPPVRVPTCQLAPQLVAEQEPARRVDDEDPAGTEPCPLHARSVRERDGSRLGRDRHEAVVGYGDAKRPQPVAIERGTTRSCRR